MAVLQGISGMVFGDGEGGKIALSIDTRVIRILASSSHSYKTATMMNAADVKSGTVSYYVPELIGASNYGDGSTGFDIPQSGLVSINIDTRRTVKYTYEVFDMSRVHDMDYILGIISNGIAMAVLADLNAHFLAFIVEKLSKDTELKKQNIALPAWGDDTGATTPEQSRDAMNKLQMKIAKLSKMFDKKKMGIDKAELMTFLDPIADVNIRNAFWNTVQGMEKAIAPDLEGTQIGNFRYFIDKMLNNNIPAGTSFSKDVALDTSNFIGFVAHNEAIAMPMNYMSTQMVTDPNTGNPKFITKYQFGIGLIRPDLIFGIVKTVPTK